jgi:hypothetical protein
LINKFLSLKDDYFKSLILHFRAGKTPRSYLQNKKKRIFNVKSEIFFLNNSLINTFKLRIDTNTLQQTKITFYFYNVISQNLFKNEMIENI